MKFTKSITLDLKTIDLIDEFMREEKITNFSKAVRILLVRGDRFEKIATKLQKASSMRDKKK